MAEVVSDSEPSPLEALRTGLNMAAALALSDATSGTGIPPGKKRHIQVFYERHSSMATFRQGHFHMKTLTHSSVSIKWVRCERHLFF